MKKLLIFGGLLLVIGPAVLALIVGFLAGHIPGCQLNEGYAAGCVLFGADISGILYPFAVLPWLTFYTAPIGLLAILAGLVLWVVQAIKRRA